MSKPKLLLAMCVLLAIFLSLAGCGEQNNDNIPAAESGEAGGQDNATAETTESGGENIATSETTKPDRENNFAGDTLNPDYPVVTTDLTPSSGLAFESNGDGTCTIVGIGVCEDEDLVIPEKSPDGDLVTLIDEYAFYNLEDIKSVTLVNASYEVGKNAFQYGKLTTLKVIGGSPVFQKSAFSTCEDLTSISFSDCNIQVDEYAFYSCGKDAEVTFSNCTGYIDKRSFQYGDFESLTISNCELVIDKSAFSTCEDLTAITFVDSKIEADEYAFYSCGDSANVTINNCSVILNERAFQYSSLDSLSITGSEVELGKSVYSGCDNLTSITITDSTIKADEYAFYSCGDSANVAINNCSVTLNERAFQYSSLDSLIITGSEVELGDSAFSSCEDLTTVKIDSGLVTLGEYAFYSCEDLISVSICENAASDNVITIDDRAFQYCEALEDFTIGNGSITIGDYVFSGASDSLVITIAGKDYTADSVKDGLSVSPS